VRRFTPLAKLPDEAAGLAPMPSADQIFSSGLATDGTLAPWGVVAAIGSASGGSEPWKVISQ